MSVYVGFVFKALEKMTLRANVLCESQVLALLLSQSSLLLLGSVFQYVWTQLPLAPTVPAFLSKYLLSTILIFVTTLNAK